MANAPKKGCCGAVDLSHIGACMHCFVMAAVLTVLCWAAFALVSMNFTWPWVSSALFGSACLFSLLLLLHAFASFTKKSAPDAGPRVDGTLSQARTPSRNQ